MLGSVVVSDFLYDTYSAIPGVTAVIPSTRIVGTLVVPQDVQLPAIRFSMIGPGEYGGVVQRVTDLTSETVRFETVVLDDGTSDAAIYPIAKLMLQAIELQVSTPHTFDSENWSLTFTLLNEIPLQTLVDGANLSRQLGLVYSVDIFRA